MRCNFFGLLGVCRALFPLLRSHSRVVNVSSSCGHLLRINGQEPMASELRNKLSSPSLTEEELCQIMSNFVKYDHLPLLLLFMAGRIAVD